MYKKKYLKYKKKYYDLQKKYYSNVQSGGMNRLFSLFKRRNSIAPEPSRGLGRGRGRRGRRGGKQPLSIDVPMP